MLIHRFGKRSDEANQEVWVDEARWMAISNVSKKRRQARWKIFHSHIAKNACFFSTNELSRLILRFKDWKLYENMRMIDLMQFTITYYLCMFIDFSLFSNFNYNDRAVNFIERKFFLLTITYNLELFIRQPINWISIANSNLLKCHNVFVSSAFNATVHTIVIFRSESKTLVFNSKRLKFHALWN